MNVAESAVKLNQVVSIIIPVYNSEKYLSKCIESCINQTYKHLEVILVDDASQDSSIEICERYEKKDSRIKVIHQSKNQGRSKARNVGLNASTGLFFMWLDSDDILHPRIVEVLLSEIIKENSEISFCNISSFLDGEEIECQIGDVLFEKKICSRDDLLKGLLLGENEIAQIHAGCWARLYDSGRFRELVFIDGQEWAEDYFYSVKAFCNCNKAVFINCNMYFYRKYNNQSYIDNLVKSFEKIAVEGTKRKREIWGFLEKKEETDSLFSFPKEYAIRAYYEILGRYSVCNVIYSKSYVGKTVLEEGLNEFGEHIKCNNLFKILPVIKRFKLFFAVYYYKLYSSVFNIRYYGKTSSEVVMRTAGIWEMVNSQ